MRRFFSSLPPGVRATAVVLVVFYLAAVLLRLGSLDLYLYLGLRSHDVWQGQVWKLATHVLLPVDFLSFVFNLAGFIMFAPRLEECWNRLELWSFCLISAVCAGVAKVLLAAFSGGALLGLAPVLFGLMAAWVKLFGREEVNLMGLGTMTVGRMVVTMTILSVVLSVVSGAGLFDVLIPICGGLGAWGYLIIRWRRNLDIPGQATQSGRINRLEL